MTLDIKAQAACRIRAARFPSAIGLVAVASLVVAVPRPARAQEVVIVNQGGESRGDQRAPNWMLLSSGLILFSGTYTASFVVAATSTHAGDKGLYAPLVGPWLDIANRCPNQCVDETGRKVLLGFDGAFQAIGAITIVGSILFPYTRRGNVARSDSAPTFRVLPASIARGAPGLSAIGTF